MKIIRLTAENVKRIKVVDITPSGDLVEIAGRNRQGKSTVLDCIWWALAGKKAHQREPVRDGADEAFVRLDLGDMIVRREWSKERGTTTVKVYNSKGAKPGTSDDDLPTWKKPQENILDRLVGSLAFDPSEFMMKRERDQYEQIRKIAALDVDLEELDAQNDVDYKERARVNRLAKEKKSQGLHDGFENLPAEKVDESTIVDELQKAGEHNAEIEQRKARREAAERDVEDGRAQAETLRGKVTQAVSARDKRLAELQSQIERERQIYLADISGWEADAKKADADASALDKKLKNADPLPEPIDPSEIRIKLEEAQETNRQFELRQDLEQTRREARELTAESEAITKRMEARTKQKMDAIANSKVPVEGLGFGEGYLTYKDHPFEQASDMEQLQVSAEIGMAENPELRVMRLRHGDQFDEDSMLVLAEIAKKREFQIWVERVAQSSDAAIVMEDGEVKAK